MQLRTSPRHYLPLVRINPRLWASPEYLQPTGSIKFRMASYIMDDAEEKGLIQPGGTIIEATSGNTGIAFSAIAQERGYKMIVVMPENMSQRRFEMISNFGAQIITVGPSDFAGAARKRDELVASTGAFCPDQFSNTLNIECHARTTGPEILGQLSLLDMMANDISAVVAGTGTGGTLMGLGQAFKGRHPSIELIGVEPEESRVMEHHLAGTLESYSPEPHGIQGIGDGFIPDLVELNWIDHVIPISTDSAVKRTKQLIEDLGIPVGLSSGANVLAAERWIQEHHPKGIVVTVLPDHRNRYVEHLGEMGEYF